jgi:sortase A
VRRTIAAIGRTLVTLGLLILLFVAYQLWGTGIFTARAQSSLKSDFRKAQANYSAEQRGTVEATSPVTAPSPTTGSTPTTTTPVDPATLTRPAPPTPNEGDVEGLISIPRININMAFVEGTSRDDLKKGPGHYPETPMPGTLGNAAIAGHRTTYLHPFYDINELQPGDKIIVATLAGKFTYKMTQQLIVAPTDVGVAANTPDAELTLTSCNPRFSAAQRIVIKAVLVPNESAPVAKPNPPKPPKNGKSVLPDDSLAEGLSGQSLSKLPAIEWGIIAALVGLAWWWAFRRWRHPATWIIGVIPFLVALFPFYVYLERALPAGY